MLFTAISCKNVNTVTTCVAAIAYANRVTELENRFVPNRQKASKVL